MFQSTTWTPGKSPRISSDQMAAHEGLVCWVVRQQRRGALSFPDALHAGRLGLWQALQHYDPTRGTRFSTYAVPAIAHAVWRAVSQDQQTRSVVLLPQDQDLPAFAASDHGAWPAETDSVEHLHQHQVHTTVRSLVAELPPRLRQVIRAHYGLGEEPSQTFAAIGASRGLTRQRVQQLHVEAVLWLAHPAHSRNLRQLLDRHSRTDYQRTLARHDRHARVRRAQTRPATGQRSPAATRERTRA